MTMVLVFLLGYLVVSALATFAAVRFLRRTEADVTAVLSAEFVRRTTPDPRGKDDGSFYDSKAA